MGRHLLNSYASLQRGNCGQQAPRALEMRECKVRAIDRSEEIHLHHALKHVEVGDLDAWRTEAARRRGQR